MAGRHGRNPSSKPDLCLTGMHDVAEFLGSHEPFRELDEAALEDLARPGGGRVLRGRNDDPGAGRRPSSIASGSSGGEPLSSSIAAGSSTCSARGRCSGTPRRCPGCRPASRCGPRRTSSVTRSGSTIACRCCSRPAGLRFLGRSILDRPTPRRSVAPRAGKLRRRNPAGVGPGPRAARPCRPGPDCPRRRPADGSRGRQLRRGQAQRRTRNRHRSRPALEPDRGRALGRRPTERGDDGSRALRGARADGRRADADDARPRHPPRAGAFGALRGPRGDPSASILSQPNPARPLCFAGRSPRPPTRRSYGRQPGDCVPGGDRPSPGRAGPGSDQPGDLGCRRRVDPAA